MSFQFPANPADGDIVVRGNLQAFYNAATNTWRVSEVPTAPGIPGPPGPPGPIGPEGQGVQISGIVPTFADLPAANAHQFEFYIVDDTNTLYFSDGIDWKDLGSPIQGPQGEPGEDGSNGTNGQNGRGWYDTSISDNRPSEYKITFLSNDGLTFTTDNIMGPRGDDGDLEPADEDTCGCIKIGRGLSIEPDGTLNAGQTFVNLETTPLNPEGEPTGGYVLNYIPQFVAFDDTKTNFVTTSGFSADPWASDSAELVMPVTANNALVYFFSATTMQANPAFPGAQGPIYPWRSYIANILQVENAEWAAGSIDTLAFTHTHNLTIENNSSSLSGRKSTIPTIKVNQLRFETGGVTVKFNWKQTIEKSGWSILTGGAARIIVVPYRDDTPGSNPQPFIDLGNGVFTDGADTYYNQGNLDDIRELWNIGWTPEEEIADYATATRSTIEQTIAKINRELPYVTGAEETQLLAYRDELRNIRNLPGTPEEVAGETIRIVGLVDSIIDYKFRYE